jgi:hypothetical protein
MLRELAEADTAALHKVYGSDEATRHLGFEPRDPRTEDMLAVADKDGELVGGRVADDWRARQRHDRLRAPPGQWGQGKGLETVRLLQRRLHRTWPAPNLGGAGRRADTRGCTPTRCRTSSRNMSPARPVRGRPWKTDLYTDYATSPDDVRYLSVGTDAQRPTALQGDTRRDKAETAR